MREESDRIAADLDAFRALESVQYFLASLAGPLGIWSLTRRLTLRVPRIFMLHRFSAGPAAERMDTQQLTELVEQVGRVCDIVTVSELLARLDGPAPVRRPLAAITVDDGYADFYEHALPVLAGLGVPATVYVTAGFIDRQCWLWWDALRYLLDAHPDGPLTLDVDGTELRLSLSDSDSRNAAWHRLGDLLVNRNDLRPKVTAQLEASSGVNLPPLPTAPYAAMTWAQVVEAEAHGIEIGNHTMTHRFLPGLGEGDLEMEITGAKRLLEQHLGKPVQTLAYPNGMPFDHDRAVEEFARRAGHSSALVAYPRRFNGKDRFRIGRWSATPRDRRFKFILNGASAMKLSWSAA